MALSVCSCSSVALALFKAGMGQSALVECRPLAAWLMLNVALRFISRAQLIWQVLLAAALVLFMKYCPPVSLKELWGVLLLLSLPYFNKLIAWHWAVAPCGVFFGRGFFPSCWSQAPGVAVSKNLVLAVSLGWKAFSSHKTVFSPCYFTWGCCSSSLKEQIQSVSSVQFMSCVLTAGTVSVHVRLSMSEFWVGAGIVGGGL